MEYLFVKINPTSIWEELKYIFEKWKTNSIQKEQTKHKILTKLTPVNKQYIFER